MREIMNPSDRLGCGPKGAKMLAAAGEEAMVTRTDAAVPLDTSLQ